MVGKRQIDNLFLVKMGKNVESICVEGQGHIFTFDLIIVWINVLWRGVLGSVNRIFIVLIKARILLMSFHLFHEKIFYNPSHINDTLLLL